MKINFLNHKNWFILSQKKLHDIHSLLNQSPSGNQLSVGCFTALCVKSVITGGRFLQVGLSLWEWWCRAAPPDPHMCVVPILHSESLSMSVAEKNTHFFTKWLIQIEEHKHEHSQLFNISSQVLSEQY